MPWITVNSSNQVLSAGTDNNPPSGAITVPMALAIQAVGNPSAWVYGTTEETQTVPGPDGTSVTQTVEVPTLTAAPPTLGTAQTQQVEILRQAFVNASNAPVTDASGNVWDGGESSGSSIFLACQMATQAGVANVTLYDARNVGHTMTVAEGMTVAATIGTAYQTAYQQWQTLRAQVLAATTVAAVQAVIW